MEGKKWIKFVKVTFCSGMSNSKNESGVYEPYFSFPSTWLLPIHLDFRLIFGVNLKVIINYLFKDYHL